MGIDEALTQQSAPAGACYPRPITRPAGQVGEVQLSEGVRVAFTVAYLASVGASAYHGYRRNDSLGWGLWWAFMGGIFPVVTPAFALAQGFGEPHHG